MTRRTAAPVSEVPSGTLLQGKRGLVMGVANDHSIAWGCARALAAQGAELAFTYQGDSFARRVVPLAESLGAEHVLVDPATGNITGIIDWSDAAITDPARDLALIYRDLGPSAFDMAIASYTHPFDAADRDRAVFLARCKVLEDIAYGIDSGARRYVENGIANLERLFA